jgi:hypothetical protein
VGLNCESCGRLAYIVLTDGSSWCLDCDSAARNMGYDDTPIARFADEPPLDAEQPPEGGRP